MIQTSPSSSTGLLHLLRNRAFVALWVAQILSQIADKVLLILLIAIAISPDYAGYILPVNSRESSIMIAFTLPAIFFGSLAGIYADMYPKRKVMIGCNLLRGLLVLSLPFLPKMLALLLAVTFAISTLTQLFAPAEQAAIPLVVDRQGLMSANALFTLTMMGAMIVGFAIGAPLLKWSMAVFPRFGFISRELLVGGIYLLSGACLWLLPNRDETVGRDRSTSVLADLTDGLRYVRENRLISGAMLQLILLYSVFAALMKFAINLTEGIGLPRDEFGMLLAAAGIGLAVGAIALGQFGSRFAHLPLPLAGFVGIAFVLATIGFITNVWMGLSLSVILGFHGALVAVPMQTAIQQYTPEHMRGKVFGLLNNGENIAVSLPLALAAVALDVSTRLWGDLLGLQVVMVGSSLVVALLGLWAWSRTHRALEKVL